LHRRLLRRNIVSAHPDSFLQHL